MNKARIKISRICIRYFTNTYTRGDKFQRHGDLKIHPAETSDPFSSLIYIILIEISNGVCCLGGIKIFVRIVKSPKLTVPV